MDNFPRQLKMIDTFRINVLLRQHLNLLDLYAFSCAKFTWKFLLMKTRSNYLSCFIKNTEVYKKSGFQLMGTVVYELTKETVQESFVF